MKRTDILEKKAQIIEWIDQELSKSKIAELLNCKIDTLNKYLEILHIKYKGQQCKKGQYKGNNRFESIDQVLEAYKNKPLGSHKYKLYLFRFGVKEKKCECCGNTMWNGQEIPLELHHLDGNHFNNALNNIQILCPNCHALQPNNSGKACKLDSSTRKKSRSNYHVTKYSEEEITNLIVDGKIDTLGRVNDRILSAGELLQRRQLLLDTNLDFNEYGWKFKAEQLTGLTRHQIANLVKKFPEDFKK